MPRFVVPLKKRPSSTTFSSCDAHASAAAAAAALPAAIRVVAPQQQPTLDTVAGLQAHAKRARQLQHAVPKPAKQVVYRQTRIAPSRTEPKPAAAEVNVLCAEPELRPLCTAQPEPATPFRLEQPCVGAMLVVWALCLSTRCRTAVAERWGCNEPSECADCRS